MVIHDRDEPIASIERIESAGSGADRLAQLYARGIVKPPKRPISMAQLQAVLDGPLPRRASLSAALQANRDEGRLLCSSGMRGQLFRCSRMTRVRDHSARAQMLREKFKFVLSDFDQVR